MSEHLHKEMILSLLTAKDKRDLIEEFKCQNNAVYNAVNYIVKDKHDSLNKKLAERVKAIVLKKITDTQATDELIKLLKK